MNKPLINVDGLMSSILSKEKSKNTLKIWLLLGHNSTFLFLQFLKVIVS